MKILIGILLFLSSMPAFADNASERTRLEEDYLQNSRRAAPRDGFPVLHNPDKASVEEADQSLKDNEWVIGVEINGEASAYPVRIMGFHELINDQVGGLPITVCW